MAARPDEHDAVPTYTREGGTPEQLAATEWVLTNGLGGFAMGTALGMPTRRYHGLLVAALSPPVQRHLMLHSIADTLVLEPGTSSERRVDLTHFCFRGGVWTGADNGLVRFEKDVSCRWVYRIGGVELTKSLHLLHGRNAAVVRYRLGGAGASARLELRPLVAMRDAHALLHATGEELPRAAGISEQGLTMVRGATRLEVWAEGATFAADAHPWHGFEYARERERGFDCVEDLVSPGVFSAEIEGNGVVSLSAWVGERPGDAEADAARTRKGVGLRVEAAVAGLSHATPADDLLAFQSRGAIAKLVAAAGDFVVQRVERVRESGEERWGESVIAGYPWFTDWGRDAMISLPGLLLVTGRHGEALTVLSTLARHCRRGLIPNNFDDHTGEPSYNTVDASLWFLHAACEYLRASDDRAGFDEHLRAACLEVVEAYGAGTDYGIRVDRDGLVMAGDAGTQLTWMDARRDGVVFTPRHGKPVEISALWHHGLLAVADAIAPGDPARAERFRAAAARTAASFPAQFWNPERDCLYDVLQPAEGGTWRPNDQVRPNQILAVSLPHSPLDERRQRAVVQTVRAHLLTPHGLRTLDPADPAYRGRFAGPIFERDAAYHNGTVWPWLMGPFAEAVLRVGRFSLAARADARELLRPLIERMDGESLGQIAEVFDGDDQPEAPQRPGGCIAQAWSVAEVLRAFKMACGNGAE